MTIEDVAEKAVKWSQAVSKITKAVAAAVIAIGTAVGGVIMLWPGGEEASVDPSSIVYGVGYSAQCSQLMDSIDHNWSEQQWVVWEKLRRDMGC